MSTVTVTDALQEDHRRLDGLLKRVSEAVGAGELDRARALFREVSEGLDRHIHVEENVLFPAFERATGMTSGPTQVMRAEHVAIRRDLGAASQGLARGDAASYAASVASLVDVLGPHNMKEERVLYPMSDEHLSPSQVAEVVSRLAR